MDRAYPPPNQALKRPSHFLQSRKTIASDYLKRIQRLHALMVNWFAFLGLALALALLLAGQPIGWVELGLFFGMWVLTEIGITVGFHRHFTHRSFNATTPVRVGLAILGSMAAQGTPIFWASLHRWHHQYSDRPGDPHSPYFRGDQAIGGLRGWWHSYIGWTTQHEVPNPHHYAPDLLRDRAIARVNRHYFLWVALGLLIPTVLGGLLKASWMGAFYGFLWGGALRICLTHNLVWSITSITHIFGSRDFNSGDRSTNNFWLAIPTLGESWHNNHHAFPGAAIVGWEWWQIDISGWIIRALENLGLAWDINRPTAAMLAAKRLP